MAECFFSALLRPSMQTNEMIYLLMFLIRVRVNEYGLKAWHRKEAIEQQSRRGRSAQARLEDTMRCSTWFLRNKALFCVVLGEHNTLRFGNFY